MGIKYSSKEGFFDKWNPLMAYTLGYIFADGHIIDSPYMRGKYLNITSTDFESITRIKSWLESEHKIIETKSHFSGSKTCYVLRIGSHKICNKLFEFGVHPRKSLNVIFPNIPQKYFWHFIRGYFDGDGCVNLELRKGKTRNIIVGRLRVIFTSGSVMFLEKMNSYISENLKAGGRIYKSKRSHQLIFNTSDSVQIFCMMYKDTTRNSFFMRKFGIFSKYFGLRPERRTWTIDRILKLHNLATW